MGVRGAFVLGAVLACLLLSARPALGGDIGPGPSQGPDDWAMYGGSAAHTFSNAAVPPPSLGLVWSVAGNRTLGSAVEADGYVYAADLAASAQPAERDLVVWKLAEANGTIARVTRVRFPEGVPLGPPRTLAVDAARVYAVVTLFNATTNESREVLVAINVAIGTVAWRFTGTTPWMAVSPTATRSAPTLVGSLAIFGSQDGSVYAVNAATGSLTWWFPTGDPVNTVPAALGTIVYVTSGTDLAFLDVNGLADGDGGPAESGGWTGDEIVMPVDVGAPIDASPVVVDPYVYVAAGGDVWAFDRTFGGAPVWTDASSHQSAGTPAISGNSISVRRSDGRVYAFDRTTGDVLWVRGGMQATGDADAALADGRLFLTATTATGLRLVTFDAATGGILHQASLPGSPLGAPVPAGDKILVSSGTDLLAFRGQPDIAVLSTDIVLNADQAENGRARGNLTVVVRNVGDEPAVRVRVRVYDGTPDPSRLIADFIVGNASNPVKAGGRSEGNFTAMRDWSVGRHEVWVVADPLQTEENQANNQAVVILYVEPGPPETIVVGAGPYYLALLLGLVIGAAVLYLPLKRLRDLRRKDEEKAH